MSRNLKTGAACDGFVLTGLWLFLIAGAVLGWLALGNYLIEEHRRLILPEIVGLWIGDALALFWFLLFTIHWIGRRFVEPNDDKDRAAQGTKSIRWILCSLAIGMVAEFGLTIFLIREEEIGLRRARPTVYNVTKQKRLSSAGAPDFWKLEGTYADGAGNIRPAVFRIADWQVPRLPAPVQAAIRGQKVPQVVPLVYDPIRPTRYWIPQLGNDDPNRLHWFSLLILLFQGILIGIFLHSIYQAKKKSGSTPAWSELHQVVPLTAEAFILILFGTMELGFIHRLSQ